jgi:HlyD family secretion protein
MSTHITKRHRASIRRHLWWGMGLVILMAGGVGGWATTTEISGAVIAPGSLVVESEVKTVQHPAGGIVGDIRAHDGDFVRAGDVLVRLDPTVTRANLAIIANKLLQLAARKARLEAEREDTSTITFPQSLLDKAHLVAAQQVKSGERRLFNLRRAARQGQKALLRERIAQLRQEIAGIKAQAAAKAKELKLIGRELEGARSLWKKGLIPITKLTALEREETRTEGQRGSLAATLARTRGKISETELEIIQIDRNLSSDVAGELREIEDKISEFLERRVAAEDQLKRIDIRAPQDGTVHQSSVHTLGGVIGAGETIMMIVPRADKLSVEARVAPQDIDQLRLGQPARLRFSAFNQRTTPTINGTLRLISADITTDERSRDSYYIVRIALSQEALANLGALRLVPGMPVEAFIRTDERSVISYLIKPLSDQVMRAFREE